MKTSRLITTVDVLKNFLTMWPYAYLARTQNVVHVFEKSFVLYLVVAKYERDAFALTARSPVQELQVIHQVCHIVRSTNSFPPVLTLLSALLSSLKLNFNAKCYINLRFT